MKRSWYPALMLASVAPSIAVAQSRPPSQRTGPITITGEGSSGPAGGFSAKPNVAGTVSRTLNDILTDSISVLSAGAKADGSDDTDAIERVANAHKEVFLPAKPGQLQTIYWTRGLSLTAGTTLRCERKSGVVIKLLPGSNKTVVSGENYASLVAQAVALGPSAGPNAGADFVTIRGCTIDGNRAAQTATGSARDAVNGFDIYGVHPVLEDVTFLNILGNGMRTNYQGFLGPDAGVEGRFENVRFARVGRTCWVNNGPSDTQTKDMMQQDCGDEADNTYYGTYHGNNSSIRAQNYHGYHSFGQPNRVKFNVSTNGGSQYTSSHFEGGRAAIETRAGIPDQFSGNLIYAPFGQAGACQVWLRGTSSIFIGNSFGGTAATPIYAVCFGDTGFVTANNTFVGNLFSEYAQYSPFNFIQDGGANLINGKGFASATGGATMFTGSPNPGNTIDYDQGGGTAFSYHRMPFLKFFDRIATSFLSNMTAAGTTSGDATAITAQTSVFTNVPANSGGRLPAAGPNVPGGMTFTVTNKGANDLRVYPPAGAIIDAIGFDAGAVVTVGTSGRFMFDAGGQWRRL